MEGVPRQNAWRGGRGLTMNCPSLPARHAIRQARIGVHNGIRLWRPSLARAPWPVAWRSAAPPRSRRRNHLSAEDRISISPARCTFLLQRLPAIDIPEGCPLAPSQAAVVEAGIRSLRSIVVYGPEGKQHIRSSPSSALQKSGPEITAKKQTPHICRVRRYQAKAIRQSSVSQPSRI